MTSKSSISSGFYAVVVSLLVSAPMVHAETPEPESNEAPVLELAAATAPEIALGAPYCDNAVLQRDMKLPVWGWSDPGTKVTVAFAGQSKSATAGKDGKWTLVLDPLKASLEPAEMVITESTGKSVTLKNILVGEVWMASGQSNMQWKVDKCDASKLNLESLSGNVAPIREFEITSVYAMLHPIERATGAWKNGEYGEYSAIAFAFAHKLYNELKVPIGILNCSFSQTSIQAWVPRIGFRDAEDEYTKAIYKTILQTDPATPEHKAAWDAFYTSLENQIVANDERVKKGETPKAVRAATPGNMQGNRDASWMFNGRLNGVIPYAIRGAIWNQGYANMGEGLPYYNNLHSMIRGWRLVWETPELPVYFHQFYCPGNGDFDGKPSIDGTAEMRLGTWLARDIPHANMASQIDVQGAIHYGNKAVPGQRLALHALKNQYGQKIVSDGPMYKSYEVKGDKLTVEFEHAEGGLIVAETKYNAIERHADSTGFSDPRIIENGDAQVKHFYLAGEDRVWHPAEVKIMGEKVTLSSPGVSAPRGVSYGTGGIGFTPNLYNKALLPMTPFIYFDNTLVTSKTWPDEKLKIANEQIDTSTIGLIYEYRKMPLLSEQFRDDAVFQADTPVTIWGSVRNFGEWQHEPEEGDCKVHFNFVGIEKTIQVTPAMDEWSVVVPAMKASAEPQTLKVSFTINGELAHERVVTNVVYGDVWYVGAPAREFTLPAVAPSGRIVRMITNNSKRSSSQNPSRFSVSVSRSPLPENRFASYWKDASGLAGAIGHSLAAKTGRPVGIIFMQTKAAKGETDAALKLWLSPDFLNQSPSTLADYKTVGALYPGNPYYNENIRNYIAAWKTYWSDYIPEMITTKAVPDGKHWGTYPSITGSAGDSQATQTYNIHVYPFTPASLAGIIFLASDAMVADDQGANFGPEMSALANCYKTKFGGEDLRFIYTIPGKSLAPKITQPATIKGQSVGIEISDWSGADAMQKLIAEVCK